MPFENGAGRGMMEQTPMTKWWGGAMLLLAAAALTQVDCSSSSSRGPATGGAGPGAGGTGSGTGGATGLGGSLPGECDGSFVPTGDPCVDAELKYQACCFEEDLGMCDSSSELDICITGCILASTCDDMRAFMNGDNSSEFATCGMTCTSTVEQFQCHDGLDTIPWDWVCDGEEDCSDGSDELDLYCAA